MTLAFCRIFHTIVQRGSFVKAAETLHMTPSAVSHAVADAERNLGLALFTRTKGGVSLTETGKSLYPSVLQLLNGQESLRQVVDQLKGLERGTVKVGLFNSVCTNWMPEILESFANRYPGITIAIFEGSYEDVIYWIKNGVVDFGFLSTSCTTELPVEPLYRDPLVCLVPPGFHTRKKGCIGIEEMKNQRFVIQRDGSDADVQSLFKKYQLQYHSDCHVLDDTSIMAMVACGRGISIMPTLTALGLEGGLKTLRIVPEEARIIGLSTLDKAILSPAASELYAFTSHYAKTFRPFTRTKGCTAVKRGDA